MLPWVFHQALHTIRHCRTSRLYSELQLGYTPLHQAAQQGQVIVVNTLLKHKASPNAVTNVSWDAIMPGGMGVNTVKKLRKVINNNFAFLSFKKSYILFLVLVCRV